jgi:hypothetical protein
VTERATPVLASVPPTPTRVRGVAAGAMTGLALAAVAGGVSYVWLQRQEPQVVAVAPEPKPAPPAPAAAPAPALPEPAPVAVATPEPKPAPARPPAKKHEPAKPAGQGVVAVGGAKAQRAEILVDGHSQGYAPKHLELSWGAHDIMLVTPGGDRIGPHHVDVTQLHTELEPLKWIVE